jgi:glutamyl-tRNA reductase
MGRQILDLVSQRGLLPSRVSRGSIQDGCRVGDESAWPQLGTALRTSDVVVFATSAQQRVLTRRSMETVMQERAGRPITILDLALPRNVAPAVRQLPDVRLIDLDEVQYRDERTSTDHSVQARAVDLAAAAYCRSVRARRAGPLIAELRRRLEQSCSEELRRHAGAHTFSEDGLRRAATAIAGTIAHAPTVLARDAAADDDSETLGLLARAFNLPPVAAATATSPPAAFHHRRPRWALGRPRPAA